LDEFHSISGFIEFSSRLMMTLLRGCREMWTGFSVIVIALAVLWTKRNAVRSRTANRAGEAGVAEPSAAAAEAMR
jgi:hypothetical protein